MVAHKSDTARDASRRERNFTIGKSCESPRLKGVFFDKQCSLIIFRRGGPEPGQSRVMRQLGLVV